MGVGKVLSFDGKSLLESFVDVSLDVVLVELAFALFVLSQVVSHFFVESFFFLVKVGLDGLVVAFAFVELDFDL